MAGVGRLVRAAAALGGTGIGTLGYAVAERSAYVLRRVDVRLLAPGAGPLRLLHLSDLHLTPRRRSLVRWTRGLAALDPDLVIATGDFLAGPDAVDAVVEALEPLLAVPGGFVPGNNDYWGPRPKSPTRYWSGRPRRGPALPWPALAARLAEGGWADLSNRRVRVRTAGLHLELRGVDDAYLGRDRYPRAAGPVGADVDLAVGVTHTPEPRVLDAMTADGVPLLLAGHTHGGQVRVPRYGALTTNCGLDRARARGLSSWEAGGRRSALHVSAGLGTSPYAPIRFCCRPEATLLTVLPRGGGG